MITQRPHELYFLGNSVSYASLKKFLIYLLLPYILLGCSRDGPPYQVELHVTVWEKGGAIKTVQAMRIGIYREGGLPPFHQPILWTHFRTDSTGTIRTWLELPQPPEYYTLWIDSLPAGYTTGLEGAALSHRKKQSKMLFVDPP